MSTAEACVFAGAPNAVDAPEKIFERVFSWAWTSSPITVSHFIGYVSREAGGVRRKTEVLVRTRAWRLSPSTARLPAGASWLASRRRLHVPVRRELILMRDVEHLRLAEV